MVHVTNVRPVPTVRNHPRQVERLSQGGYVRSDGSKAKRRAFFATDTEFERLQILVAKDRASGVSEVILSRLGISDDAVQARAADGDRAAQDDLDAAEQGRVERRRSSADVHEHSPL